MEFEETRFMTLATDAVVVLEDRVHCLEGVEGLNLGRRHAIGPAGLTLGRTPPADLVLGDSEVSRGHCRITLLDGEVLVSDLNSTNGTRINGVRITEPSILPVGGVLQVGRQSFKHEWLTGAQFQRSAELDRDLATAASYVLALLPPPLRDGAIRADWVYRPCSQLGGDAFGYGQLSETLFNGYLIDVSGHGAGAAMHSVAVMNLLRQRALPDTDMARPAEVLRTLNEMFQMSSHADMYFTMWYGVYDVATRRLDYASAGHHPAYIKDNDAELIPLRTRNGLIGALLGKSYQEASVVVPPGASLYVFSDGVFEIVTKSGQQWGLADFLPLISAPPKLGQSEPERLLKAVQDASRPGEFEDDFSLVVMTFD